jgi:hypothetical protein
MEPIFTRILKGKRKHLFGSKSLFQPYKPFTDIVKLENEVSASLPDFLKTWLSVAGYGDINDKLSFRSEWFNSIDVGELKGHIVFAQDDLGNLYSFSTSDGAIHFINRSEPEFAFIANNFKDFLEEFERRGFELEEWTNNLQTKSYNWSA